MWYAIIGQDVPNSLEKRMAARPAHVARLQELQNQGRLLLAGPFPAVDAIDPGEAGFTGSLIVAEFPSLPDSPGLGEGRPLCNGRGVCRSSCAAVQENISAVNRNPEQDARATCRARPDFPGNHR